MTQRSEYLKWIIVLLALALLLAVRVPSAHSQSDQLGQILVEPFDHPLEGWEHTPGVTVADGAVTLESGNYLARGGEWDRLTLTLRFRQQSPGPFAVNYHTSDLAAHRLIITPTTLILQHRSGNSDQLTELIEVDVDLPLAQWHELAITSLGERQIVSLYGEPVLVTEDSMPLPPGGIMFEALEGALIELDDVTLTTWVSESFDSGFPPNWERSDAWTAADGLVSTGASGQVMAPPGWWSNLEVTAQIMREPGRRVSLVVRADDEQGYRVDFAPEGIQLFHERSNQPAELLAAQPSAMNEGGGTQMIGVLARGEQLLALVDGQVLLEYGPLEPDRGGAVILVTDGEGEFFVDQLDISPPGLVEFAPPEEPIPPPQEPQPMEEITLQPGQQPPQPTVQPPQPGQPPQPTVPPPQPGQPANPTAQPTLPQAQVISADLAVTDLYPGNQPYGQIWARITNNGPDRLTNAAATLNCTVKQIDRNTNAETTIGGLNQNITITLAPGQTQAYTIGQSIDLNVYAYDTTCTVGFMLDPNSGNNSYNEQIGGISGGPAGPPAQPTLPQMHVVLVDLTVTDIFPQSLPTGNVDMRITNNGPDALTNATVGTACTATIHQYVLGSPTTNVSSYRTDTITLAAGQTGVYSTGIGITNSTKYWYEFTCEVNFTLDSNIGNNSYSETIPPPP